MDNLKELEQYAIDRDLFCQLFGTIWDDDRVYDSFFGYESYNFKAWRYEDEFYVLHKPSGTLINWYKHLGRTNTCNKKLTIDEYAKFVEMFYNDVYEVYEDED